MPRKRSIDENHIDFTTLTEAEQYLDEFLQEIVYPLSDMFDSIQQGGSVIDADGYQITVNKVGKTLYVLSIK